MQPCKLGCQLGAILQPRATLPVQHYQPLLPSPCEHPGLKVSCRLKDKLLHCVIRSVPPPAAGLNRFQLTQLAAPAGCLAAVMEAGVGHPCLHWLDLHGTTLDMPGGG
jgi:hypothetical protein